DGSRERPRPGPRSAAAGPGGRQRRLGHPGQRPAFRQLGDAGRRARPFAPALAVHPVGAHPPAPNRAPLRPALHRRAGRAESADHPTRDPDRAGGACGRRGGGRPQSQVVGAPPLRRPLRRLRGLRPVADRARRRPAGGRFRPRRAAAPRGLAARAGGGGGLGGGGGRDHRARERRPRRRGGGHRRRPARPGARRRGGLAHGRGGRGRRRHGGRRARVPAALLPPGFRGGGRPGGTRAGRARWQEANRL
ncbi:MAG: hypothetical protein AVDCRST_MAG04-1387, partial [uncultured Acetobacteraceae bacterium]